MNQAETLSVGIEQAFTDAVLPNADERSPINKLLRDAIEISSQFRTFLAIENQRLKMAHQCGAPGCLTAAARSCVLDLVVKRAYQAALPPNKSGIFRKSQKDLAVVALGGYGRGELAPHSDLDILFLLPTHRPVEKLLVERILYLLWDAGVVVGHSLRTVNDCVAAAQTDPHLQTALVNTRLLAGEKAPYRSLLAALEKDRRKRTEAFIAAILRGRDERYARFGSTVCLQEPNIKESAGGLRDLHTALWASYARCGCRTLRELRARELILEAEERGAMRAANFLWRVRCAAHLTTGRKTERIELDLQATLARDFGYKPSAYLLGSEKFMRDYYRHARALHDFSETLLGRACDGETKASHWWSNRIFRSSAETLFQDDGTLQVEGKSELFAKRPSLLFEAFARAQDADVLFSPKLRAAIRESLPAVDREFRASSAASSAFLKLLAKHGRGGYALRLMHETGFLSRFVPEFRRVSLLIHHDHYHHYTVDEHTLKAAEALDELHRSKDKQRAHLRPIFDEIEDPALLYLSVLLHDIGKGCGRGHIPRGVKIAERICKRFGLDDQQSAKVLLLVALHVAMAHLAQRRDLNEPHVVADFAAQVRTPDSLNMLFLLTYADLKAVGPGVWSEWKSTLLWELHRRTRVHLTGSEAPCDEREKIGRFKEQMTNWLQDRLPFSEVERHLALLPDRYIRVTSPESAAIHLHLIEELKSDTFSRQWIDHRATTELMICARDRHALCADIAGVLAANGIEILSAELHTREDGIALDVFMLREASTLQRLDADRFPAIERALRKAIAGESDIGALVESWRIRNAPRKPRKAINTAHNLPQIACDNEASQSSTLIEVRASDEPGLVFKIASQLAALGLDIVCAKIATEKSDALDTFYVTDGEGMKLSNKMMQAAKASLAQMLLPVSGFEQPLKTSD